MMVILNLTFILLEHFLSLKMTPLLKLIDVIRCYKLNTARNLYCFLYFCCLFLPFSWNKNLLQSLPFNMLYHIYECQQKYILNCHNLTYFQPLNHIMQHEVWGTYLHILILNMIVNLNEIDVIIYSKYWNIFLIPWFKLQCIIKTGKSLFCMPLEESIIQQITSSHGKKQRINIICHLVQQIEGWSQDMH